METGGRASALELARDGAAQRTRARGQPAVEIIGGYWCRPIAKMHETLHPQATSPASGQKWRDRRVALIQGIEPDHTPAACQSSKTATRAERISGDDRRKLKRIGAGLSRLDDQPTA
jgi:hypothetical protein